MLFDKKGDLSIRFIILFSLGLIVLIVVVLIFYSQSSDFAKKLTELASQLWQAKPDIKDVVNP